MIPLLSILKLFAFIINFFVLFRVYESWKKNPTSEALYCFFSFFFSLGIIYFSFIFPPLGLSLKAIQIVFCISNFFIFIGLAYLLRAVFLLTYFTELRKIIFWIFVLAAFGGIILDVIFFKPASVLTYQFAGFNFIGWVISSPSWLTIIYGIVALVALSLAGLMFFIKGSKQVRHLRIYSYYLGLGMFSLGIAAMGYLFFGSHLLLTISKDIIHGLFSILAVIFIAAGILYKEGREAEKVN